MESITTHHHCMPAWDHIEHNNQMPPSLYILITQIHKLMETFSKKIIRYLSHIILNN